jgi:hypothetical protein
MYAISTYGHYDIYDLAVTERNTVRNICHSLFLLVTEAVAPSTLDILRLPVDRFVAGELNSC